MFGDGGAVSGFGAALLATAAVLFAMAFTPWGAVMEWIKLASVICAVVGAFLIFLGPSITKKNNDTAMRNPPALAPPPGYANPNPGGVVTIDPLAGSRPYPGQQPYPAVPLPPVAGLPPPPLPPGKSVGPVTLTGTFAGTFQGNVVPSGVAVAPSVLLLAPEAGRGKVALAAR